MTGLKCLHCGAATNGVVLCARCSATAAMALRKLAEYHDKLFELGDVALNKIRRHAEVADPTGNQTVADPEIDDARVVAASEMTTMLAGWVRLLIDDRPGTAAWPANSVIAMTTFLREHLRTIAVLEWAGAFVNDLLEYERRLQRIVSVRRGRWNAGVCGAQTGEGADDWCAADLFVQSGMAYVRCPACGGRWSVEERRKQVIEKARDLLLPVADIARAAVALLEGEPSVERLTERLKKWVQRKQLDDYGVRVIDGRPQRVYQVGEVMDLLTRETRTRRDATNASA